MMLAMNQYGDKLLLKGVHPRKELSEKTYMSITAKMYVDTAGGEAKHIGYVVGSSWWTLYNVTEWEG